MRWLDEIIRKEKEFGVEETEFRNQIFSKSRINKYGINVPTKVYVPAKGRIESIWRITHNSHYYAAAEKEAEMLRRSIVDESIPYQAELVNKDIICGGRETNAMLLGIIRYHEACPELVEAATHDTNYEMRAVCVGSLGDIKEKASRHTIEICKILLEDKDLFVRTNAAEACEKIRDRRAIKPVRETIEELKPKIRYLEAQGYPFNGADKKKKEEMDWSLLLFEQCLKTLFKLDQKSGREELAKGLDDTSGGIEHFSKRALFFTDIYEAIALERGTISIYLSSE